MVLNEAQKRHLARVAYLMATRCNCDVMIQIREGGIRTYEESVRMTHDQLPSPDHALQQIIDDAIRSARHAGG